MTLKTTHQKKLASFGNMQHSSRILTLFSVAHAIYPAYCENPCKKRHTVKSSRFAAGCTRSAGCRSAQSSTVKIGQACNRQERGTAER